MNPSFRVFFKEQWGLDAVPPAASRAHRSGSMWPNRFNARTNPDRSVELKSLHLGKHKVYMTFLYTPLFCLLVCLFVFFTMRMQNVIEYHLGLSTIKRLNNNNDDNNEKIIIILIIIVIIMIIIIMIIIKSHKCTALFGNE